MRKPVFMALPLALGLVLPVLPHAGQANIKPAPDGNGYIITEQVDPGEKNIAAVKTRANQARSQAKTVVEGYWGDISGVGIYPYYAFSGGAFVYAAGKNDRAMGTFTDDGNDNMSLEGVWLTPHVRKGQPVRKGTKFRANCHYILSGDSLIVASPDGEQKTLVKLAGDPLNPANVGPDGRPVSAR